MVDFKATVYFGSYHSVDSSDMAFKVAASMAFKDGFLKADPYVLEPIYTVDILVPEEFMGDVMGDISSKRGKILGMDRDGHNQRIKAHVPLAVFIPWNSLITRRFRGKSPRKSSRRPKRPKKTKINNVLKPRNIPGLFLYPYTGLYRISKQLTPALM